MNDLFYTMCQICGTNTTHLAVEQLNTTVEQYCQDWDDFWTEDDQYE